VAPGAQFAVSGIVTFGVPLLLAVRELVSVQRTPKANPPDDGQPPAEPKPLPPGDVYSRPLPDCLIPKRLTEFTQELA
jgi:hypothetical protein